ncbi:MAG: hypothetical protein K2P04_01590 [Oscillospiraceae bacterium]|nr:hypothetical protein [Oscillospiraceae bacterium]
MFARRYFFTEPAASIAGRYGLTENNVAVNESAEPAPDAAPLYRDPALYNEEIWDTQGVRTYYGWELAPADIPDDLAGGGKAVSGRIVREKAAGNVVEDQAGRSFWVDFGEDGRPKSCLLDITIFVRPH